MTGDGTLDILNQRETALLEEIKRANIVLRYKWQELRAIRAASKILKKSNIINAGSPSVPKKYSPALRLEDKIIFVLHVKKLATIREITDEILKRESKSGEQKPEKLYPKIQQIVLRMIFNNKILKIGHYKSKYKLNAEIVPNLD